MLKYLFLPKETYLNIQSPSSHASYFMPAETLKSSGAMSETRQTLPTFSFALCGAACFSHQLLLICRTQRSSGQKVRKFRQRPHPAGKPCFLGRASQGSEHPVAGRRGCALVRMRAVSRAGTVMATSACGAETGSCDGPERQAFSLQLPECHVRAHAHHHRKSLSGSSRNLGLEAKA